MSQQHCTQCHTPIEPDRYTCRRCGVVTVPEHSRELQMKLPRLPHISRKLIIAVLIIIISLVLGIWSWFVLRRPLSILQPSLFLAPADVMVGNQFGTSCSSDPELENNAVIVIAAVNNETKHEFDIVASSARADNKDVEYGEIPKELQIFIQAQEESAKEQRKNEVREWVLVFRGTEYPLIVKVRGQSFGIRKYLDTVPSGTDPCDSQAVADIRDGKMSKWAGVHATSTEAAVKGEFTESSRLIPGASTYLGFAFQRPPGIASGDRVALRARIRGRVRTIDSGEIEVIDAAPVRTKEAKLHALEEKLDQLNQELVRLNAASDQVATSAERSIKVTVQYNRDRYFFGWSRESESVNLIEVRLRIKRLENEKSLFGLNKQEEENFKNYQAAEQQLIQKIGDTVKLKEKESIEERKKVETEIGSLQTEQRKVLGLE